MDHITIGMDIGSTAIKGVLYDAASDQVLATEAGTFDLRLPSEAEGHHELDPERTRQACAEVLAGIARQAAGRAFSPSRIAFTGQMHGGLVVDDEGAPLTPVVTWQDARGDEPLARGRRSMVETAREAVPTATWRNTGGSLHTGFLGATWFWMRQRRRVPRRAARLLGLTDWLASSLLGTESFTDPTMAASWGLYDVVQGTWSDEILQALLLPRKLLPPVIPSGTEGPPVDRAAVSALGLPASIRLVSGLGDTQASYLGSGCRPDEILINIGTGSQLMWETRRPLHLRGGDLRPLPSARGTATRFLVTCATLSGGESYAVLARFLADVCGSMAHPSGEPGPDFFDRMNELASSASLGAGGLRVLPLFAGSRSPGMPQRARIEGLDAGNFTAANLCRAVLEGMVEELSSVWSSLPARLRVHRGVVGSGNGLQRNEVLRQIVREQFRLPLRMTEGREEAAVGAARLAAGRFEAQAPQAPGGPPGQGTYRGDTGSGR